MRDPELVARAQRAATRLESAWEQWRALHGLADAPGQPVVSYVGYSLKEPWGEPRVVIGIDADEAEYLAEFLDRDECAPRGQVPGQQASHQQASLQKVSLQQAAAPPVPLQPGQLQQVPLQAGPLQSGPLQQVSSAGPVSEGAGEYPALFSPPPASGRGRQAPDQGRDIAAELVGWNPGERPGQLPEQFASWPPSLPPAADQPPASA
jgi:hypothetical protein